MVSRHPTKFGGHRHCGSDMFLVVGEQDLTCSLLKTLLLLIFKARCMPCSHTKNFRTLTQYYYIIIINIIYRRKKF